MSKLESAIARARQAPPDEQDIIANAIEAELRACAEYDAYVEAALREAFADVEAGRTHSFDEVMTRLEQVAATADD